MRLFMSLRLTLIFVYRKAKNNSKSGNQTKTIESFPLRFPCIQKLRRVSEFDKLAGK